MPSENRLILKYADEPGYTPDLECYLRHGGYEALKKVLALPPKTLPDGRTMTVGVGMARGEAVGSLSDHTVFVRPLTEVDFSFDQSLRTAHLSGTFNAVLCGPECVPAGVFILDITWKGVGTRRNQPMGQVRQYEDCSASLNHIITRDAVAFGTINGVQVEGTGTLYNYFYPPLGDCWGGSV